MASMRLRSPPRMQTSRSWLSPRARAGDSVTTPLGCACASARLVRRRVWATSDGIAAGLADAPPAARTRDDVKAAGKVRRAADGHPAAVRGRLREGPVPDRPAQLPDPVAPAPQAGGVRNRSGRNLVQLLHYLQLEPLLRAHRGKRIDFEFVVGGPNFKTVVVSHHGQADSQKQFYKLRTHTTVGT